MAGAEGFEDGGAAVAPDRSVEPSARSTSPRASTPGRRPTRARSAEWKAGAVLVAVAAAAGLYLAHRPGPTPLDSWIRDPWAGSHSGWLTDITTLRYPAVVVVGAVLVALSVVWRDRARAVACLVGPPLALLLCELAFKPLVGRTIGGGLSYPSGSTVGAAALATAAVLATPARWRTVTVVVGAAYALWMAIAVVSLGWHYPTDALAGLAFGCGVVLLTDGFLALVVQPSGRLTVWNGRAPAEAPANPPVTAGAASRPGS